MTERAKDDLTIHQSQEYREKIIKAITSRENLDRKKEARRRYDVFKDGVRKYVETKLAQETDGHTVIEMMNRATNLNICKKIVNKLARVYKTAPTRKVFVDNPKKQTPVQSLVAGIKKAIGRKTVEPEKATAQIQYVAELLDLNNVMKKTNRWVKLQKNAIAKITPHKDSATGKFKPQIEILHPGQFDVVEDENDPTKPMAFIFSDGYVPTVTEPATAYQGNRQTSTGGEQRDFEGNRMDPTQPGDNARAGNQAKSPIAEVSYTDEQLSTMRFYWWTRNFNFVTNGKGEFVDGENKDHINKIGEIPIVTFAEDQDGQYWALGGEDLVDGTILMNLLATDLNYILMFQGMGLFYVAGRNVPSTLKVGPNFTLSLKTEDGEPPPSIGFASSNPPVDAHLKNIEQQVAVLLSSNNLEPSSVSTKLDSNNVTSGIHELIKRADVTEAIEDEQAFYLPGERAIFRIVSKWMNHLNSLKLLDEDFALAGPMDPELKIAVEYQAPQVFTTEKEKLEVMQMRRDVGLDTLIDTIKRDNPALSDEDAQAKAEEIQREKQANAAAFGAPGAEEDEDDDEEAPPPPPKGKVGKPANGVKKKAA